MAWITTDKTGGSGSGTITVSASDNTVLSSRNGTIVITNGNTTKAVSVVQYSKPSITRQPPYTMAKAEGGDIYITVKCYSEWWFRSIYDWITIIDGNGNTVTEGSRQASTGDGTRTFTFRLSGNTNAVSRNDTISIGYLRLDGTEVTEKLRVPTYTIEQYGQTQKQSLPQPPSKQDITPSTSTLSWNATTDADWITLIKSTGVKGESVTYTVTENTGDEKRTGKITITYSDGSVEIIEITQKGVMSVYDIDIEADSYDVVAATGGTKTITVTCDTSWTLSSDTEGVVFSPASGTGNGTATMTIPENAGDGRSIKVTGTSSGGRTDSFTIAQAATAAENFSVIPSSISADYGSGNQTLKVVTNTNWSISSVPDWIGCVVDGTTVTVSVQKNDTGSERSGNIIFTYGTGSGTYTVPVTQKSNLQEISLKASTTYVYGENATAYLYITCEGAWTLEGGDGYALFDKNSGKGNATVLVMFSGIGKGETKTLTFTATSSNTATATIDYLYEKPYIDVSDEGLAFNPESESKKITIDSNICWTVEEDAEPVTENTKIYYTSNKRSTPYSMEAVDKSRNALTYTNTYSDGQGVIEFDGVVADIDMQFYGISNLKTFDGVSNRVKLWDANHMFYGCKSLESVSITNLDTSKVIDMNSMFQNCVSLNTIHMDDLNTSRVTNMSNMFYRCNSLTVLDVSNFDTSKVIDMNSMFSGCHSLTTLDVSNWNTSRVTDMSWMFDSCSGLISLNLNNWDTSSVTDMSWMFDDCSGLTSLNLNNWNTLRVTNMQNMFCGCSSLTSLDLSNWNTLRVTDMQNMFCKCSALKELWIGSNCTIGSDTGSTAMFDKVPEGGILWVPSGMAQEEVTKWTSLLPEGWTAVAY